MNDDILEFRDENRWLSNFWPCRVELDWLMFTSVESAYVAAKTTDVEIRKKIQQLSSPGKCKRFGRSIILRSDWDDVKIHIMELLLRQKFTKNSELANKLISTGGCHIYEGNTWGDTFWGICNGEGQNNLGVLLMKIRNDITNN